MNCCKRVVVSVASILARCARSEHCDPLFSFGLVSVYPLSSQCFSCDEELPPAGSVNGGNHSGKELSPAFSSAGLALCLVSATTGTRWSGRHSKMTSCLENGGFLTCFSTKKSGPIFHMGFSMTLPPVNLLLACRSQRHPNS